jgi:metallo-beta-lactamase family protein
VSARLTFWGAAGEVTGSMHLVEAAGRKILLDCGLFQGRREEARRKNERWPLENGVDAVVLSHSHIDHAGRLPLLIKRGYAGPIFCTPATRDLSAVMLPDAGHIQEKDFEFLRKRGVAGLAEPLYTAADATRVAEHMIAVPYDKPFDILPGVRITFTDAGHILGSASVALELDGSGRTTRLVFSGDIGRTGLPIIRDPKPPAGPPADVLVIESTYANRVHESVAEAQDLLAKHVNAVAKRGGKIFIPSFAVGRAQELIYELHGLAREQKIPEVPIYVDSPLAVNATDVFRLHTETFDTGEWLIGQTHEIFRFPLVRYVRTVDESKALNAIRGPAVIIAASGMAESGRILHHLRNGLGDHRNLVLMVGFQASYTLGNRLREGAREVKIYGEEVEVRAEVALIGGYSAHADRPELKAWVRGLGPAPRRAFVVHGETDRLTGMAGLLKEQGVPEVAAPRLGESFDI